MMRLPKAQKGDRTASVQDRVLETLLDGIFSGTYRDRTHLPTERDLVSLTGASRISIRGALARLAGWRLVETRHGSGTVVLPRRQWSFAALPALVRHRLGRCDLTGLLPTVRELLALRGALATELLCRCADRMKPGDLDPARAELRLAWEKRNDTRVFLRHDLEKSRLVMEAAGLLATLWLLNSVTEAYLDFAAVFPPELIVPRDYLETHLLLFAALEANDSESAREISRGLLERQDREILTLLSTPGEDL